MSISSLLTSAEELAPDDSKHRMAQTRRTPTERLHTSPESLRPSGRQAFSRATQAIHKPVDTDETDSEQEPQYVSNKAGFRHFKYHSSMIIDTDKSDSDMDSDEFVNERMDYMKNMRKRQIEVEEHEALKRKVYRIYLQLLKANYKAPTNRAPR